MTQLKPTGPVSGPVLGAFIDGVASTVDKASLKVYKRGKKYNEWEFIWNPIEEQATALQQGLNPAQQGQPGQPGQPIGPGAAGTGLLGNTGSSSPNGNGDASGSNGLGAPAAPPGASPSPLGPGPQPPPQSPP